MTTPVGFEIVKLVSLPLPPIALLVAPAVIAAHALVAGSKITRASANPRMTKRRLGVFALVLRTDVLVTVPDSAVTVPGELMCTPVCARGRANSPPAAYDRSLANPHNVCVAKNTP